MISKVLLDKMQKKESDKMAKKTILNTHSNEEDKTKKEVVENSSKKKTILNIKTNIKKENKEEQGAKEKKEVIVETKKLGYAEAPKNKETKENDETDEILEKNNKQSKEKKETLVTIAKIKEEKDIVNNKNQIKEINEEMDNSNKTIDKETRETEETQKNEVSEKKKTNEKVILKHIENLKEKYGNKKEILNKPTTNTEVLTTKSEEKTEDTKNALDTNNVEIKEKELFSETFDWDEDFFIVNEEGEIEFIKEKMIDIDSSNYYSPESNFQYMNSTQYGNWIECEAKEKAIQNGEFEEEENRTFILGNYVHSWNDNTMEEYIEKYRHHLFKRGGEKYSDVKKCDAVIETFERDEFITFLLRDKNAEKEIIAVSYFASVWWKVRIDDWNLEKTRIIDVKTSGDMHKKYWDNDERKYVNFVEHYNYMRQMAIYQKAVKNKFNISDDIQVLLVVGEKNYIADKMVVNMSDPDRFEYELRKIEENMPRILRVKYGLEEPNRCGVCDYCKSTKQLSSTVYYKNIEIN
jgi:hypothetical protein